MKLDEFWQDFLENGDEVVFAKVVEAAKRRIGT